MKRYNLSQIMKDAHRLYNNEYQRKGRSWANVYKLFGVGQKTL